MRSTLSLVGAGISVYVLLLLALLAIRFSPFVSNGDDFIRYYFGGYVGSVRLTSADKSRALDRKLEGAWARLPSTHERLRFQVGKTPYVPLFLATTPVGMAVYLRLPGVHPATWILGFHTVLWALGILAGAFFIHRNPQICGPAWFLAAGVVLAWLNEHTSPLVPVPRGVSTLAAGLGLACYLTGSRAGPIFFLLVLGALFHPFQILLNVGAIFLFLFLIWSERPLEFLKSRKTWQIGSIAVLAAFVGIAVSWLANAKSFPGAYSVLDVRVEYSIRGNWEVNQEAFHTATRNLGLPLLVLVYLEKGWKRTLGCAALLLGTLFAVALLGPSGPYYPGEYVQRMAAMWIGVLFGVTLKRDFFRSLMETGVRRPWSRAGIAIASLVFLWQCFDAWNPEAAWRRFVVPSEKEWGPVETECIDILVHPL